MQVLELPPGLSFRHVYSIATRWSDEDNQSVLNNAVYPTLFEEARLRYFGGLGQLAEGRFPFLLAQSNVRFRAPGRGGDLMQVEMATTHVGRSSFEQAYRVLSPEGELLCEAQALLVTYDPATNKSAPMGDAFRASLMGADPEAEDRR